MKSCKTFSKLVQNFYKTGAKLWLLDVTEESDSAGDPTVGVYVGFEHEREDVGKVCALWLFVDRHLTQVVAALLLKVDGKDVHHRQQGEEDLWRRTYQTNVLFVPACSIQVQTVHIHP